MGVTYKLTDEVVHFIVNQRQGNPLASCRQLAESASQKFSLNISKSSVHDVLKESGISTPRGRKPKDKFEIPQEKKKQIQSSLSKIKLLPDPVAVLPDSVALLPDITNPMVIASEAKHSPEYEGAGKIFLKAALWDLGIYAEEKVKAADWDYYLTYVKGVKVVLENDKSFFIDLPLPLERCIREVADGLINNVHAFVLDQVSDLELFKSSMNAQPGFKIGNISIVDQLDHIVFEIKDIVDLKREYCIKNMYFVESNEISAPERAKLIFFSQILNNNNFMEDIMNLKGFDTISKDENLVTLLLGEVYENKALLESAVERLNRMFLRDEQGKLLRVATI